MAKQRFSIFVDRELVKRLDMTAKALGMSRSALIQQLCEQSLDEVEVSAKVFTDPVLSGVILNAFSQPGVIRSMMGVMKDELTSDQLELFVHAMTSAAGAVNPPPPLKLRRQSPRKGKRK